jgi:hypothetical protein
MPAGGSEMLPVLLAPEKSSCDVAATATDDDCTGINVLGP